MSELKILKGRSLRQNFTPGISLINRLGIMCMKLHCYTNALCNQKQMKCAVKQRGKAVAQTPCKHSDFRSEMQTDDQYNSNTFSEQLIDWAISNKISQVVFSKLLKVLVENGVHNIPKTSKTLLKARESSIQVIAVEPGIYVHYGIEEKLKDLVKILMKKKLLVKNKIELSIFIDNLPLKKKSNIGLWTILGSIADQRNTIFTIGAYLGASKPNDSNLFLSSFVNEVKDLYSTGLTVNDEEFSVGVKRVVCDAPAKCFILNIKNFLSYSSCTKCNVTGEYGRNKVYYPEISDLKVDNDYLNDQLYKGEKTKLLEIPDFGVVTKIPLDYMHLVCLGVTKKLISIWMQEHAHQDSEASLIARINKTHPNDFKYKAKSIGSHENWNASNLRQFLLYYGPLMVKDMISAEQYNHFLMLHAACRILCTAKINADMVDKAETFLRKFIQELKELYGIENVTHNIHGLFHLVDDCRLHGTLDSFSAFQYEDYLTKLKFSVKKCRTKLFLQSVFKHAHELRFKKNLTKLLDPERRVMLQDTRETSDNFLFYKCLRVGNSKVFLQKSGDGLVLLKTGALVKVSKIFKEKKNSSFHQYFIAGNVFGEVSDFYVEPIHSSSLNIFKASKPLKNSGVWPVDMIDRKCLYVNLDSGERLVCGLLDENY